MKYAVIQERKEGKYSDIGTFGDCNDAIDFAAYLASQRPIRGHVQIWAQVRGRSAFNILVLSDREDARQHNSWNIDKARDTWRDKLKKWKLMQRQEKEAAAWRGSLAAHVTFETIKGLWKDETFQNLYFSTPIIPAAVVERARELGVELQPEAKSAA